MGDLVGPGIRQYDLAFVPFMLLMPIVGLWLHRRPESPAEDPRLAQGWRRMRIATLAAFGAWLALLGTAMATGIAPLGAIAGYLWVLFYPLWFGIAAPVLQRRHEVAGLPVQSAMRTASLEPRTIELPALRRPFAIACAVLLVLAAGLVLRGVSGDFAEPVDRDRWHLLLICFGVSAGGALAFARPLIRASLLEAEPLDARGSESLIELYRDHRRTRCKLLLAILVAVPAFFGLCFNLWVWLQPTDGELVGTIGGIGGTLIGCAGGAIGIIMSRQRMAIARARAALDASAPAQAR